MATNLIDELERIGLIAELEQLGASLPSPAARKGTKFSPEYLEYLRSEHWQARRDRIQPKVCAGCHTTQSLQLHHRVYPPKGSSLQAFIDQPDSEFTWLCELCHEAISQSMRQRRKPKKSRKSKSCQPKP